MSSCEQETVTAQPTSSGTVSAASTGTQTTTVGPHRCNNKLTLHRLPIQAPFHPFTCPWFPTNLPFWKGEGGQSLAAFHSASSLLLLACRRVPLATGL